MDVGYLGVGNMGLPMAGKVMDAGHGLVVFDRSEAAMAPLLARQARRADSPRDMADRCETVFVSLPTLDAFRSAVTGPEGLIHGKAMKLLVNTCTVGVPFLDEMVAVLADHGVTVLDCPISGGPAGARAGTLSVMISGDPAAREKVMPLISGWGTKVTVAGDKPGAAQVLKLTNNLLFIISLAATSEAFVMGAKGGLNPEVMVNAINAGSGRNGATNIVIPNAVLDRSFHFGASLHILEKDIDLAIEMGERLGVPMWVSQTARLMLKHIIFTGAGDDDISTVIQHVERGAGFELPKVR
jgi:2-hydroxy-3-oxopropionate reductase